MNGDTSSPEDLSFDYNHNHDQSNLTHAEIEQDYGTSQGADDDDVANASTAATKSSSTYQNSTHNNMEESADFPITHHTFIFCMCAALNSCNLGYDIGVSTVAGELLQAENGQMELSDLQMEMWMGSINLFAIFGALFASSISDRFGRRRGFLVAAVGFIFGVVLMASASTFFMLMLGRVFVGLGVGFGLAIDPLYISELAPASQRGKLVTWSEIATNVGIVLGFTSGLIFFNVDSDVAWRVMFGLGALLPTCLIILVTCVMPESPRWLVANNRIDEAKKVLQKVYPHGYNVDKVIDDIKVSIKREQEAQNTVGWDEILFPSPAVKRMLLVGLGAAVAQQLVGIDSIQYFLTYIMKEAGIDDRLTRIGVLIFLGFLKLIVIVIAGDLFDKRGRRPLFFTSLGGMIVALLIIAITLFSENTLMTVVGLALYLSFFSLGMGPGAWLIPSEVFPTGIRAKAMSIATFLNRITATIMSSTFLSVAKVVSYGGFFILLAFVCVLVLVFFNIYLPETKGRSLEDMTLYFAEITGDRSILDADARINNNTQQSSRQGRGEGEDNFGTFA